LKENVSLTRRIARVRVAGTCVVVMGRVTDS